MTTEFPPFPPAIKNFHISFPIPFARIIIKKGNILPRPTSNYVVSFPNNFLVQSFLRKTQTGTGAIRSMQYGEGNSFFYEKLRKNRISDSLP